jgi:hypothetical protein
MYLIASGASILHRDVAFIMSGLHRLGVTVTEIS